MNYFVFDYSFKIVLGSIFRRVAALFPHRFVFAIVCVLALSGEYRYPFIRIKWLVVGYNWGGIGGVIFRLVSVDIQGLMVLKAQRS